MRKVLAILFSVVIMAVAVCCAGAETAQDISSKCEFFAGSGRTGEHAFAFTLSKQYKKTEQKPPVFRGHRMDPALPAGRAADP